MDRAEQGALARRLIAIMSADVVGFSKLMGADEAGTFDRLEKVRSEFFDPTLADHNGRIVKLIGDGCLVEFQSVVDAVNAAIALQMGLAKRNENLPEAERITFRIGVHLGDVIIKADDIYGDGVNIAARLESIAPEGGIAISEAAFSQVTGKVVAVFEDAGKRSLKNIAEPVRIYRWPSDAPDSHGKPVQGMTGVALSGKPAIIILPFENLSHDPEHDIFAVGITEDVIYGISRFSELEVIGRYSSSCYAGRRMRPADLRRELGVRYVVEGSVRRGGDRVRVSVELTDSKTGKQLWSNRYDRVLSDIFDLEDEVVASIVAALPGRILEAERERVKRLTPSDMTAYDYMIAGRLSHHKVTPEDNRVAVEKLNKAIELDPNYAEAYAWKACTLGQQLDFGFAEEPAAVEREALDSIDKALELNPEDVECHRLLCEVGMLIHRLDQAVSHNEQALSINPNDPRLLAQKGEVLTWLGQPEAGIEWIEKAMQVDPYCAPRRAHLLGSAYHAAHRYDEAARAYAMATAPTHGNLAEAAACRMRSGDEDGARVLVAEALRQNPNFSVEHYTSKKPFASASDREHLAEGLKLAGFPG